MRLSSRDTAARAALRSKKSIALVTAVLVGGVLSGAAVADIWNIGVAQDSGNVRLRVQHMTTANFDSGWHYHPGLVVVQVTKGSLTFTQKDCKSKTYSAGDTFIEVPYTAGRVVGIGEAAMTATLILGYGDPLQVNVPNPCP